MCLGSNAHYLPEIDNVDLCSFYQFDHSFMCQVPESQLRLNRDRGTPLICDNKLAGLMSVIVPSNITNSTETCTRTLRANAFYTKVALYEKWIRSLMAVNSPEHTADGKPIPIIPIAPPYESEFFFWKNLLFSMDFHWQIRLFSDQIIASKPGKNAATNISPNFIMMILVTFITWLLIHKSTAI